MKRLKKICFVLFITALSVPGSGRVMAQESFVVHSPSRFWISGSSNVNRFTCETEDVEGGGALPARSMRSAASAVGEEVEAALSIEVASFDCGHSRMNADMYEALKAGAFPHIRFRLIQAELLQSESTNDGWRPIRATSEIIIAGQKRILNFDAEGQQTADSSYRVRGSIPVKMTDFGVKPPIAMLGLVRAKDDITVHFDVAASTENLALSDEEPAHGHNTGTP